MITKFTQNSDIKMIIEEKQIATNQVRSILRKKGIFSIVANANELSNQIYPIYFGSSDIENMKELMQVENNYKKSSLMSITPKDKKSSIEDFLEIIADELQNYKSNQMKYKIDSIVIDKNGLINMRMTYIKKVKGKVELIKDKKKEIDVKFKKDEDNSRVLIDIRQNDNSDLKEFDNFISLLNTNGNNGQIFDVEHITLDKLTKENKIKFYDDLIMFSFLNWRIEDIKGIDVKRNEELENEDEDEEEISQGLTSDELFGINSAMFKGNSIRDSGIVKKFEDQGFYFTSMKIKYSYKKATESFIVDVNFKGTENVKIDIISTYDNVENRDLKVVLSMDEQEKIIQEFQIAVNKIFANLIKNQIKH